jgi:serine/threonine protein phosphatase PrpC
MENEENVPAQSYNQITSIDSAGEPTGISFSLRCHPGKVREENQDCVGSFQVPFGELFLVLDGVGGRSGGARASALGLEEYRRFLSRLPAETDPLDGLQQATTWVKERLEEAKESGPPAMHEMASTVALVLIQGGVAYVGHIGDSRVYRLRGRKYTQLTRDHSVVQRMVDEGLLSHEQAQTHPSAHILTRSLGQSDASLEISSHEVQAGDVMLICSDGLWGYTPTVEVEQMLAQPGATVVSIADALLQLALAGEAGDNISVVVLRVGEAWKGAKPAKGSTEKRFSQKQILAAIAITMLLAGAAVYLCL